MNAVPDLMASAKHLSPIPPPADRIAAALADGRPAFGDYLRGRQLHGELELILAVPYVPAAALIAVVALIAGCAQASAPAASLVVAVLDTVPPPDAAPDAPPPPVDAPPAPPVDAPPPPPFSAALYDCTAEYSAPTRQGWSWQGSGPSVYPTGVLLEATPAAPSASMARLPITRSSPTAIVVTWAWQGADAPDVAFTVDTVPGARVQITPAGWGWADRSAWVQADPSTLGALTVAVDGKGAATATVNDVTLTRTGVGTLGDGQIALGVSAPAGAAVGYIDVVVSGVVEGDL